MRRRRSTYAAAKKQKIVSLVSCSCICAGKTKLEDMAASGGCETSSRCNQDQLMRLVDLDGPDSLGGVCASAPVWPQSHKSLDCGVHCLQQPLILKTHKHLIAGPVDRIIQLSVPHSARGLLLIQSSASQPPVASLLRKYCTLSRRFLNVFTVISGSSQSALWQ